MCVSCAAITMEIIFLPVSLILKVRSAVHTAFAEEEAGIILPVLALIGFMILGLIRSKEQQQSRCFMEREAEVCSVEQNYSGKKG